MNKLILNKIPKMLFSSQSMLVSPETISINDIEKVLLNPTSTDVIPFTRPQIPEKIIKKIPESIFDLNKTKLDDMYEYYLETNNIQLVNKKFGVQILEFKFGLPIPNMDPCFKNLQQLKDELNPPIPTSLENLYSSLNLTGNSSFENYEKALKQTYNFHESLGGVDDESPKAIEMFAKSCELTIPFTKLRNETHMLQIRKTYSLNLNIPGCVEVIDPRKFFPNLRPVEEFRHTPIIPISFLEMRLFEERKEKRKYSAFEIVYTKERLATLLLFFFTGFVILVFFKLAMDTEEKMIINYRRKRAEREKPRYE